MSHKKHFIVSAVIPVYNGEQFIAQTLHSLISQTMKFDEIIVVDDGSTDNTVALVTSFAKHGIKLIQLDHVERVAARNIGWKAAKGNIIAFIDSDLVLVKDWLKEVLKGFDQGHVAVVDRRAVYQPKTYIAKMNDHFFDIRYADHYKPFTLWIIQKSILKQLGGYDLSVVGIEDADLADRLMDKGHAIYFAPKAIAYHKGEPRTFFEELRRHFWFGSHILPYWKKLRHIKRPLRSLLFLLMTLTLFFRPVLILWFFFFCYLYVLLRHIHRGMHLRYLFVHPLVAVLSEFSYAYGIVYGLLFGPMKLVR